ncbi:MAG: hypothetical protein ACR2FU_05460 [Streptosporangiaceae bacterium]
MADRFDLVIIGGGNAGYIPAIRARQLGMSVALIGKALIEGDPDGFFKIVVDAGTNLILGMHAIGPHVTELIAEGSFAKLVEGTPEELGMNVHAHPSLAEIVGEAAMAVDGLAIHF